MLQRAQQEQFLLVVFAQLTQHRALQEQFLIMVLVAIRQLVAKMV
jgi:hypothetical protein